MPKVSVIIPVYNNRDYIREAIDSILNQTFEDIEIVICDDASTDGTGEIIQEYAHDYPDKIKAIKNNTNRGVEYSSNRCIKNAKGQYIARMDGDDVSHKDRIEKQVRFLEKYPKYDFVSTPMILFDEAGVFGCVSLSGEPNKNVFSYKSPFPQPSCVIKKKAFLDVKGYKIGKRFMKVEDWDLWIRLYERGYRGYILSEALYYYREDREAYRRRPFRYRINETMIGMSAVRKLRLPKFNYLLTLRPILVGLLPSKLYIFLHRRKFKLQNADH